MRPDFYGLEISPSIPKAWELVEINKEFRGKQLEIKIFNPNHAESGCKKMIVNGKEMPGNYIPDEELKKNTKIEYYLS